MWTNTQIQTVLRWGWEEQYVLVFCIKASSHQEKEPKNTWGIKEEMKVTKDAARFLRC